MDKTKVYNELAKIIQNLILLDDNENHTSIKTGGSAMLW